MKLMKLINLTKQKEGMPHYLVLGTTAEQGGLDHCCESGSEFSYLKHRGKSIRGNHLHWLSQKEFTFNACHDTSRVWERFSGQWLLQGVQGPAGEGRSTARVRAPSPCFAANTPMTKGTQQLGRSNGSSKCLVCVDLADPWPGSEKCQERKGGTCYSFHESETSLKLTNPVPERHWDTSTNVGRRLSVQLSLLFLPGSLILPMGLQQHRRSHWLFRRDTEKACMNNLAYHD